MAGNGASLPGRCPDVAHFCYWLESLARPAVQPETQSACDSAGDTHYLPGLARHVDGDAETQAHHCHGPSAGRAYQFLSYYLADVFKLQIALGGWTSANYAALACPDVPMCMGQWWPQANFQEGFVLWREIGVDYEGGLLDQRSRVAIHLTHRIGAIVTLLVLIVLAVRLIKIPQLRGGGQVLMALVLAQFTLGVLNVALYLPLANAVAHSAGAALLLATLLGLLNKTTARGY